MGKWDPPACLFLQGGWPGGLAGAGQTGPKAKLVWGWSLSSRRAPAWLHPSLPRAQRDDITRLRALAWMGCGSWVFKRTGARGTVCLRRLEVRTGSLSTAELCPGLGCSEPDCLREGNLSGHCLPCGSLVLQGRRRNYISTLGSPGVIEEGLLPCTPSQYWPSSVYLGF